MLWCASIDRGIGWYLVVTRAAAATVLRMGGSARPTLVSSELTGHVVRYDYKQPDEPTCCLRLTLSRSRLHTTWTGEAAVQHQWAHDEWKRGVAEMRAGLTEMRRNAEIAHGNYSSAVNTNSRMWGQAL